MMRIAAVKTRDQSQAKPMTHFPQQKQNYEEENKSHATKKKRGKKKE
jgi:hypothetical protein